MSDELRRLRRQRNDLRKQIGQHKADIAALKTEANKLSTSADQMAVEFRSVFGAASQAYGVHEGAAASALAAQGRALVDQCKVTNEQAGELRDQAREKRELLDQVREELKQVNDRINALTGKSKQPKRQSPVDLVAISGFEHARGIDEEMVREVLRDLAPRLVEEIESVAYVDEVQRGQVLGLTDALPNGHHRGRITIFKHPLYELEPDILRQPYRDTLVHETGHVLFDRIANKAQRFEWGKIYLDGMKQGLKPITPYANKSLREDFAECFRFYRSDPRRLYRGYKPRYDFIDRLYKEISS